LDDGEVESWDLRAVNDVGEINWFDLDDPPPLTFDHVEILSQARRRLV
jgi:hypothetical protein